MKFSQITVVSALCFTAVPVAAGTTPPPELESDSETASAGYYQLNWEDDTRGEFILEEAPSPSFDKSITLYRGPDTATLISGRSDGTYYYRIRNVDTDSGWSDTTKVEVSHHTLHRALIFFALGAVVFIATLMAVVIGNKRNKNGNG